MSDTPAESKLRIACLQMEPRVGDKSSNVAKSLQLIETAAAAGAKLVVLPELCNSGYVFETRDEAFALAERCRKGRTSDAWHKAAATARCGHRCRHRGEWMPTSCTTAPW